MADMPFSINAKFINQAGAEILMSVRGTTIDSFTTNVEQMHGLYPEAGLVGPLMQPAAPPTPIVAPVLPVNGDVAASADTVNANANMRAAAARANNKQAPKCAVHNRPMLPSKHDGVLWYCSSKNDDGTYCDVNIPDEAAA